VKCFFTIKDITDPRHRQKGVGRRAFLKKLLPTYDVQCSQNLPPPKMKKLSLALLVVENNDYQAEQVIAAEAAAHRLGVQIQILHTEHDAILQAQQVLKLLQSPAGVRPQGILFEPVGTPLAQAAASPAPPHADVFCYQQSHRSRAHPG
jgi:hypothetical protein